MKTPSRDVSAFGSDLIGIAAFDGTGTRIASQGSLSVSRSTVLQLEQRARSVKGPVLLLEPANGEDEATFVQVIPSSETSTMPAFPTITNRPLPKAAPSSARVVPLVRGIQTSPLVEIWMVPRSPAPTNNPFPYVTIDRFVAVLVVDGVHAMPSGDATTFVPPIATNFPLP